MTNLKPVPTAQQMAQIYALLDSWFELGGSADIRKASDGMVYIRVGNGIDSKLFSGVNLFDAFRAAAEFMGSAARQDANYCTACGCESTYPGKCLRCRRASL